MQLLHKEVSFTMQSNSNSDIIRLIRDLSAAFGPSGFEDQVTETARQYIGNGFTVREDCLRNLYIYPDTYTGQKPVFLLDAHSDEVGFMVHSIKPNGTLRFVALGGWNAGTLPSSKVLVRNRDGQFLPGIIAAKPVHFMTAAEKEKGGTPDIRDLVIDIGAVSQQDAMENFGIRIGEPIVPDVGFQYDEKRDIMMGKAFDCRIGCAALIETLHRLSHENLDVDVVGVLSSQEEVGDRGVKVAVNRVKPQIALCFEGCPADDTFTEPYAIQTALKKGPMLRFMDRSIICSPRYQRYALDLAQREQIPVQASVREGGGNNGAVINTALDGIPVIVAGIPVRYIHSHHGIASLCDFEAAVSLAVSLIKSMTKELIESF